MNSQWMAYQNSQAFAARVATLYGAGEQVLENQRARYGKLVERFEKRFGAKRQRAKIFTNKNIFFIVIPNFSNQDSAPS